MKNLYVPNPCSENWESMSFEEKGRFCSVCSKCVIDFTQKKPEEIQQIIEEKKEENICGRFYNYQLESKINQSEKLKNTFLKYIPSGFQNNRITFTVLSLILFLTGCSKPKESCNTTTGVFVTDEDSIPANDNFTMGEARIVPDDTIAKIPKEKNNIVKDRHKK